MTEFQSIGKYKISKVLGRGTFGMVYKARDTQLKRTVALKVLHPYHLDPTFIQRFEWEAKVAAQFNHPHLVKVYEVGEIGGRYYLAMAYVEGQSLAGFLKSNSLSVEQALTIIEHVAAALDVIHGQGLIHRDVKPGNIMLTPESQAILLDFGLVRATEGTRLTQSITWLGTPEYMAPEQIKQGEENKLDNRVDIYALGIVAYEILVGRLPFVAPSPIQLLYQHVHEAPPPPIHLKPNLTARLEPSLLKALAKAPAERFQRAGEFAVALRQAWQEEQLGSTSPSAASYRWALGCLRKDEDGDLAGAETAFQNALEYDPDHQDTLKSYSLLLLEQARYEEAERYLATLAEIDPVALNIFLAMLPTVLSKKPELMVLQGNLCLMQDKRDEAEVLLRQAIEQIPDQVAWLVKYVQLLTDLNRQGEAIYLLRQAFERHLADVGLYREYARLMARQGRYDEVDAPLKRALELGPDDPETLALRSEVQEALSRNEKVRGRMALAIMKAKQGLQTEARRLFKDALSIDPNHVSTLKRYASFLEQWQEFDEAEQVWTILATTAPEEADVHFQNILSRGGETPTILNSLARALLQLNRMAEAEAYLRHSLALEADRADTLLLLVETFRRQGNAREAEKLLSDNLDLVRYNSKLSLRYAQLLAARYHYSEAKKFYRNAQELDPADEEIAQAYKAAAPRIEKFEQANLDMAYGRFEAQAGNYAGAEKAYQQALAIDPNHVSTLKRYASLLEDTNRPLEAGELLSRLAQLDPVAAEEHYLNCLPYLERYPESRCAYALLLQDLDRAEEAIEQFRLVLEERPDYQPALIPYITLLLDRNEVKTAEEMLKSALEQDSSIAEIHWYYGQLLARHRHRYNLADNHFEVATILGDESKYQEAYSQNNIKLEQIRKAEYERTLALMETEPPKIGTRFEKAYQLCPDYIPILLDYGKFLAEQGQLPEARRYLQEALRLDPYDEGITQYLSQLDAPPVPEISLAGDDESGPVDPQRVDTTPS